MSGPGEGKFKLKDVSVYIHQKGKSRSTVTHLDIESSTLGKIIKDKEITFVKGKKGGFFIALKKPMITRAEKIIQKI